MVGDVVNFNKKAKEIYDERSQEQRFTLKNQAEASSKATVFLQSQKEGWRIIEKIGKDVSYSIIKPFVYLN